jgi:hypothetical protein
VTPKEHIDHVAETIRQERQRLLRHRVHAAMATATPEDASILAHHVDRLVAAERSTGLQAEPLRKAEGFPKASQWWLDD